MIIIMRIAHVADIHIQDRRRAEYAAVFDRLYAGLRAVACEVGGLDFIVVAGDVFDNKMRASAHNLEDVAAFLSALADIAPVILIAGNHDTNCLTPGALDLLTPLLADSRALQAPRLTYWRHSGVYAAHGAVWAVAATDGAVPTAGEVDAAAAALEAAGAVGPGAFRFCLFHDEVRGAQLGAAPNGVEARGIPREAFAPFDAAFGGHIHLRQML
ncbi:MAG: hypothetical protein EBU46_18605, partial [Nitrosomonadaceae bacterium]|nr:hypothetical protein [Nitrosomonadaceae bacterium]